LRPEATISGLTIAPATYWGVVGVVGVVVVGVVGVAGGVKMTRNKTGQ
jgi:hypothetical protein